MYITMGDYLLDVETLKCNPDKVSGIGAKDDTQTFQDDRRRDRQDRGQTAARQVRRCFRIHFKTNQSEVRF